MTLSGILRSILFVAGTAGTAAAGAARPDTSALFYRGYAYGSQAMYNPGYLIMNASFDVVQINKDKRSLSSVDYATGFGNVWWNITRPGAVISRYGWRNFMLDEVVPTSLQRAHAQYWPNYHLHLVGGGMTYVAMAEWFRFHRVPLPRVWSGVTMLAYHYLNEVVENSGHRGPNVDPIADLLLFDPLGILLFSFPAVPRFFSRTLRLADWSFQPMYNAADGTLMNNGQKFIMKLKLPYLERWSGFYLFGIEGMLGLTRRFNPTDDISVGGGFSAYELIGTLRDDEFRRQTTSLDWIAGVFYDRNNSLLASLILGGSRGYRARLNVYPGVMTFKSFSPGMVFYLTENVRPGFGITCRYTPLGLAASAD